MLKVSLSCHFSQKKKEFCLPNIVEITVSVLFNSLNTYILISKTDREREGDTHTHTERERERERERKRERERERKRERESERER